jgi:hypothetical protein
VAVVGYVVASLRAAHCGTASSSDSEDASRASVTAARSRRRPLALKRKAWLDGELAYGRVPALELVDVQPVTLPTVREVAAPRHPSTRAPPCSTSRRS